MDGTLAVWQSGADWHAPHYYRNLPKMENMIKAVKKMQEDAEVDISLLTCTPSSEATKDKSLWAQEVLPGVRIVFVPYGENKGDYVDVSENDILVDDYSPNLHAWEGRTIKVYNGINGTHGTYNGKFVRSEWDPQDIADTILNAAKEAAS